MKATTLKTVICGVALAYCQLIMAQTTNNGTNNSVPPQFKDVKGYYCAGRPAGQVAQLFLTPNSKNPMTGTASFLITGPVSWDNRPYTFSKTSEGVYHLDISLKMNGTFYLKDPGTIHITWPGNWSGDYKKSQGSCF